MTFAVSVVTLYPEMFPGPAGHSLAQRALNDGLWSLDTVNPREFGIGKHRQVDDTPAGGGPGMVLRADVMARAVDSALMENDARPRLLMSARGERLTQSLVREFSHEPGLLIVCGRFEGVDERLIEARRLREISIGDYVLSGGEPAAMVLIDAVVRLLPGVMGNAGSAIAESHEAGLLEYPQYTRPQDFEGMPIPPVLLSGDHGRIAGWREERALADTARRRPDLLGSSRAQEEKKNRRDGRQ